VLELELAEILRHESPPVMMGGGCGVFGDPTADDRAPSITSARFAGTKERRGRAVFTLSSAKSGTRRVEDETASAAAASTAAPPGSLVGDLAGNLLRRVAGRLLLLQLALGRGRDEGADAGRLRRRLLHPLHRRRHRLEGVRPRITDGWLQRREPEALAGRA